jgi:hypothetical protein
MTTLDIDLEQAELEQHKPEREREQPFEADEDEGASRAEREEWFYRSRVGKSGKIRRGLYAKASAQRRKLERQARKRPKLGAAEEPTPPGGPGTVNWTPIGPSVIPRGQATGNPPVSGRIVTIAVGPSGNRAYIGAATGGIWATEDGGTTWRPIDDYAVTPPPLTSGLEAASLAVGAIAVSFGGTMAADTIYVGTGEPRWISGVPFIGLGDTYLGVGILKSTNGGGAWSLEGTNLAGRSIFKIVIDPDNPNQVLAATSTGIYTRPAAAPFGTWAQQAGTFTNPNGQVSDLIVVGSGATKKYYAAFRGDQVYQSANGTTGWTALTGLPAAPGRIVLAGGESAVVVYALLENSNLYRLVGTAFQQVTGLPAAAAQVSSYALFLGVDPTDANTVYVGGQAIWDGTNYNLPLYKGTITGGPGTYAFPFNPANAGNPTADPTWVGRGIHADGHAIAFALNAAGTAHVATEIWVGSDGGVFRSTSSGALGTFTPRNTGIAITQTNYIAQHPLTDAVVFSGTQDNGTVRGFGEPAWLEVKEGDGGGVIIDPGNPYRIMRQYVQAGRWYPAATLASFSPGLYTCTDGGQGPGSFSGVNFPPMPGGASNALKTFSNTENSSTNFYSALAVSPPGVAPTLAAFGTNRVWLTSDWGGSWTTLATNTNPYVTNPAAPLGQDQPDGNSIESIVFASGTRIYAATRAQVFRFDLTGGTWAMTPIPNGALPAGHFITALAVDPANADRFYAVLGGSGYDHVWYYNGAAYQTAGLAQATLDIPAHAVVTDLDDPNSVYVGTDVGVWKGVKAGATWTWTVFSQGLPESPIVDLDIQRNARVLRAATYGRGVWEIVLDPAVSTSDPDLYMRVDYADTGRIKAGSRYPWVENAPDPTRQGALVYHWMSPDIKVRRPSFPAVPPPLSSPPDYLDFAVNIGDYVDTTDTETADVSGANRIFVQIHNRSIVTSMPGSQVRVLLLVTDAAAGLPALPANYATHIQNGDPPLPVMGNPASGWVAGSAWKVADPASPYKSPPGEVNVRTPGIVEFSVDVSTIFPGGLPAGHDHICAAALATSTTAADQLTSSDSSMDSLTMHDKHAVHRNLHLVAAGATPSPAGGYSQSPQTVLLDFWNAAKRDGTIDIVVDRREFPGRLALLLPKLTDPERLRLHGFDVIRHDKLEVLLREHLGGWLERAGEWAERLGEEIEQLGKDLEGEQAIADAYERDIRKVTNLDHERVYLAGAAEARIGGVPIPAGERISAAITIQPPDDAEPGDRFRFHVLQRRGKRMIGGSTYVVAVVDSDD